MKKIQKTSTKSDISLMNHLNTNHACQLSIVACIHPNVNLIDQVCFETLKALQPQHVMFACTHYR